MVRTVAFDQALSLGGVCFRPSAGFEAAGCYLAVRSAPDRRLAFAEGERVFTIHILVALRSKVIS